MHNDSGDESGDTGHHRQRESQQRKGHVGQFEAVLDGGQTREQRSNPMPCAKNTMNSDSRAGRIPSVTFVAAVERDETYEEAMAPHLSAKRVDESDEGAAPAARRRSACLSTLPTGSNGSSSTTTNSLGTL